jgi:type I restriction enzyme R subunit
MKFTEAKLELAITELLAAQGYEPCTGEELPRADTEEVMLQDDLSANLSKRYSDEQITAGEIEDIVRMVHSLSSSDLYGSNKQFMDWLSNGFQIKREDPHAKDIYIHLIDYSGANENHYRFVTQTEIEGYEKRIPDGILYVNGLPLVVFEFKSAIREEATIADAYAQLTTRYRRDIPLLFVYNALCVISDGVNTKMGSFFAAYEFFYSWRKVTGEEKLDKDGIDSLYTMIQGLFDQERLRRVIRNFIYLPDKSKQEDKIVCRYPQYYAATKLYHNIIEEQRPHGSGKGGTYFGATGCGKSFTMLFLTRMLMRSTDLESPTIVLITDRTDLDDQLSGQFTNAKGYIGDSEVVSVESRQDLRERLQGRASGGVFLTTIHKFTEDIKLLTDRTNVICISDEAHRSQINLEQKVKVTADEVKKTYGFAKYLHDSLPNATYVGFTGTPVDATLDVFGKVIDSYTMTESVHDEITVRIVYEGRAAKVLLDNAKLQEIEEYYKQCEEEGASEYAIEESKKANAQMNRILVDPSRIKAVAEDFVEHYETRVAEGSSVKGKAMFVCNSREIAQALYAEIIRIRPDWAEIKVSADGEKLTDKEKDQIKPMERVKMIMTRNKDKDSRELWDLLGSKDYRKELDRQFKNPKSNFKIAIVVDMWLTGFDVPFLDTIYIDKSLQKHNLIQTISRVNRRFVGKDKGLIVDYIGIKKSMNLALSQYDCDSEKNVEDIDQSVVVARDHLDLLKKIFSKFDKTPYFSGTPVEQLHCLNQGAEFVQLTQELEKRFMQLVKRLKAAYDICCGSEKLSQEEKDCIHFYLAIRSIVFKLTKGNAPDAFRMNHKVQAMIAEALQSDGVEEIFKLGEDVDPEVDIFNEDYLAKIKKIKLPNTKFKLLQQLLAKAIGEFKKTNKAKGIDFSKKFSAVVGEYNERNEADVLKGEVLEDFTNEILDMLKELKKETTSHEAIGIDFEEKAFYDILMALAIKYEFVYPNEKLVPLSQAVKKVVDDKVRYTDWHCRDDIKAELQFEIIVVLDKYGYPPAAHDEVYHDILEQAENFKKHKI